MKYFNKLGLFLCTAALLASCSDDNTYTAGEWDGTKTESEGFYNVAFEETSYSVEKDPTEPTVSQIVLTRTNAEEAIEVPLEVVTNTDNVFQIGKCQFAAGDSVAVVDINYPDAVVGTPYTLQLTITDKRFVSSYTQNFNCTLNLTRVKWNLMGIGKFEENYMWGGVANCDFYVRDDDSTQFRIKHPFDNMKVYYEPLNDSIFIYQYDIYNNNAAEYITMRILQPGEEFRDVEISQDGLVFYNPMNSGYFMSNYGADVMIYHPSTFTDFDTEDSWAFSKVLVWQEDGKTPAKVQLAGMYYMDGVGGWDETQVDGDMIIYFPGYKDPYKADITADFDWEAIYEGKFTSNQLQASGTATLYKGTCVNTTDDCDKVFAAEYGEAYVIASPYAQDYNLYFTLKDGQILVPEGLERQPIGINAMGTDVYAKINYAKSTFTEKVITLNITFTDKEGTKEFGTADETLSNITYTTVGTVDYTYTQLFSNEDGSSNVDAGLELQQRDDDPTQFRVLNWGVGTEFQFVWDQESNVMAVPTQLAAIHPQYGEVYISDVATWQGDPAYYEYYPCVYDSSTKIATLNVAYHLASGGYFNFERFDEYMTINLGEVAQAVAQKKVPMARKSNVTKSNNYTPWSNVKTVTTAKNDMAPVQMKLR